MAVTAKVSSEIILEWDLQGNSITQAVMYLGLPDAVIAAALEELGLVVDDHMGSVAFITDDEWEEMVNSLVVEGAPAKVGHKAKLRRLLAICRLVCSEAPGEQEEAEDPGLRPQTEGNPRSNDEDKPAEGSTEAPAPARLPQSGVVSAPATSSTAVS